MNELALTNLQQVIGSIADSIMEHTELPDAIKRRDKREPGRLRKMAYEERIARIIRKRWKKQREKVEYILGLNFPGRKAAKPPITPDDIDDPESEAELMLLLVSAYRHGVQLFEDATMIGMDYTLVNAEAVAWAKKYVGSLIKGIDDTTLEAVRNAVSMFADTPGMTLGDTMALLPFDERRAQTIAVTETTRAYAEAELEAGRALKKEYPDVRVVKQWFTSNDELSQTCDICGPMEGEEVEIDEPFSSGDYAPPAHPNCRCFIQQRTRING